MRLSSKEVEAIITSFKEVFKEGKITLFGSRVDDALKGGDIDLYIECDAQENLVEKKIDFLVSLKRKIGEQKIDVLISRDKNRAIEQEALNKGIELNSRRLKIQKYINECRKHKIRIEKSYTKLEKVFPLSALRYEYLSDEEIETIDSYLFRFTKLQETLGNQLFRFIVSEYVENIEQLTFLDRLNQLEKIEILESVNSWKTLIDIRNTLLHQYDDDPQEMAATLNNMFAYKAELLTLFDRVDDFYKGR